MNFVKRWNVHSMNQKQGDRQRTPRSPFGLRPKRPPVPTVPPKDARSVSATSMASSLVRMLLLPPILLLMLGVALLLLPLLLLLTRLPHR